MNHNRITWVNAFACIGAGLAMGFACTQIINAIVARCSL